MAEETLTTDTPQAEAPNPQGVTTQDKSTMRHKEPEHKSSFWGLFGGKPAKETPHMVTEEVPGDSSTKPPLVESTPEGVVAGAEAPTREAAGDTELDSDAVSTPLDAKADADVNAELDKITEEAKAIDSGSDSEKSESPQLNSSDTESPTLTGDPTAEEDPSSTGTGDGLAAENAHSDVRVEEGTSSTDIGGTAVRDSDVVEDQGGAAISDVSPEGQGSFSNDGSESDGARADADGTGELHSREDDSDHLGLESDNQDDRPENGRREDRKPGDGEDSQLAGTQDNFDASSADQTDKVTVDKDDDFITDEGKISQDEYQTKMAELASQTDVDSSEAKISDEPQAERSEDAVVHTETPAEASAENEGVDSKVALENYDNFFIRLVAAGIDPREAEDLRAKAKANPEQLPDFLKMLDDIEAISQDVVTSYETHNRSKSLDEALADTTNDFLQELTEDSADASHEKADLLKLYTDKLKKDDKVAA